MRRRTGYVKVTVAEAGGTRCRYIQALLNACVYSHNPRAALRVTYLFNAQARISFGPLSLSLSPRLSHSLPVRLFFSVSPSLSRRLTSLSFLLFLRRSFPSVFLSPSLLVSFLCRDRRRAREATSGVYSERPRSAGVANISKIPTSHPNAPLQLPHDRRTRWRLENTPPPTGVLCVSVCIITLTVSMYMRTYVYAYCTMCAFQNYTCVRIVCSENDFCFSVPPPPF